MINNLMGFGSSEFRTILQRIKAAEVVNDSQLLPFLTLESKSDRCQVNLELAEAYYEQHKQNAKPPSLQRAGSFIERAWLLSHYSPEVLPLYIDIHQASNNAGAIKEAFKRAGLEYAAAGNFDEALRHFDKWMYAYADFSGADIHTYDADILASVERMTALHRFNSTTRLKSDGRKTRVAYLMHGLTHVNSVLVKIDKVFASLHDKERFEIAYFTTEDEPAVAASSDAQLAVESIRASNCKLFVPQGSSNLYERLLVVGKQIYDFEPDVLITSAGLATFQNYFITRLKPAPVVISFHQASSPQFTWHTFDHSIAWFRTNIPDCPASCSFVPLEFEWPAKPQINPETRSSLDVPGGATVIVSGGRWAKFQEPNFWQVMIDLLEQRDDLYWLILGVAEDQISFLNGMLTPGARSKIRFLGWRTDYLELLATADFVIDSYPVGGGVFLLEAMNLGIPVVSFQHDYVGLFSNNDCSGGDEIVVMPELLIQRGEFEQLRKLIAKLADDREYRLQLGAKCSDLISKTRSNPERMVRRCEEIYETVLRKAATSKSDSVAGVIANNSFEEDKRFLIEQANILSQRAAEITRREAALNASFLARVRRALRRR